MLGSILDLAKYNEDKMIMLFSKVNLNSIIYNIIEEAKTLYVQKKDISFSFEYKQDFEIQADSERLGQLFRNLIVNSIKYSKKTANIQIKTYAENKFVHVTVRDNGIGIQENELADIFTPFTQGSKTKTQAGGTGLGLAIASEIVQKHHGKIWAKNNLEGGATFHILLPINQ